MVQLYSFLTSLLDGDEWSNSSSGRRYPLNRGRGGSTSPSGRSGEEKNFLSLDRIRTLHRPAGSLATIVRFLDITFLPQYSSGTWKSMAFSVTQVCGKENTSSCVRVRSNLYLNGQCAVICNTFYFVPWLCYAHFIINVNSNVRDISSLNMGEGECCSYMQYDTKHQNEWQNGSSAKVYV